MHKFFPDLAKKKKWNSLANVYPLTGGERAEQGGAELEEQAAASLAVSRGGGEVTQCSSPVREKSGAAWTRVDHLSRSMCSCSISNKPCSSPTLHNVTNAGVFLVFFSFCTSF